MARGSNNISLDAKGRISIPTRHRDDLMRISAGQMVVTISPNDRCLWLYTLTAWEAVERKLISLPTYSPIIKRLDPKVNYTGLKYWGPAREQGAKAF